MLRRNSRVELEAGTVRRVFPARTSLRRGSGRFLSLDGFLVLIASQDEVGGFLRPGCGDHHGAAVGFENVHPVTEIGRGAPEDLLLAAGSDGLDLDRSDPQDAADHGRGHLGDELLAGIGGRAEDTAVVLLGEAVEP